MNYYTKFMAILFSTYFLSFSQISIDSFLPALDTIKVKNDTVLYFEVNVSSDTSSIIYFDWFINDTLSYVSGRNHALLNVKPYLNNEILKLTVNIFDGKTYNHNWFVHVVDDPAFLISNIKKDPENIGGIKSSLNIKGQVGIEKSRYLNINH